MPLKDTIRAIMPPIVWRALRTLNPKYHTYPTWDAAAAASGKYEDDAVNAFRAARAIFNRTSAPVALEDNALTWLAEILPHPFTVVDFGGATGEIGAALQARKPDVGYTVVENPTLVALMAGRGSAEFAREIPASCDVFYTSGTLQYLPDPYTTLAQGFASATRAVILKRNYFSERRIFRVHTTPLHDNGRGKIPPGFPNIRISYPCQTVSEKRIMEISRQQGFRLLTRTPETDGVLIPEPDVYGAQLAFLKIA